MGDGASIGTVTITVCRERDVELLERYMPSPGRNRFHARRFARQEQGLSTYLVAWLDERPVGSGAILWGGCGAVEVRRRYADCPELGGLGVWPPELRSRGIGTALIRAAEARVRERGHGMIGLGVNDDNHAAAALYLRLGYQETGCHYLDRYDYVETDGVIRQAADPTRFLVKPLDETS
ncbi:GNAT family N-acetyltransferase [Actinoallomurus sp. CA-150999]|uniref:GNAT family N-acetyltransferase n=1 Tax=Actinoallomurus sp. CA-150999 TaxID=3239887 RepID=UPI003D8D8091